MGSIKKTQNSASLHNFDVRLSWPCQAFSARSQERFQLHEKKHEERHGNGRAEDDELLVVRLLLCRHLLLEVRFAATGSCAAALATGLEGVTRVIVVPTAHLDRARTAGRRVRDARDP